MSKPGVGGGEWLLINKFIVWSSIHGTLRGRGGLEIIKPCLCRGEGSGRWQVGVVRSWETRDCFDSTPGRAAVFALRPASRGRVGFSSGLHLPPGWAEV